ncbi:hypothetical protein LIER_21399 [Lithospermum erythrorhizon]|uniref:Retrotransposon gag domain-containing protein n=1 Tax=Lithospermum erythrorhizon TaxID=34254 RepID=A0AAV3QVU4_LITER
MGNCCGVSSTADPRRKALPIDSDFLFPSSIPNWPPDHQPPIQPPPDILHDLTAAIQALSARDEEDNSRSFQFPRQPRAKIDFPRFEGGDSRGWILKAEKYFRYFQIPNEMKVEMTAMYLEGEALDLYSWINGEEEILLWEDLFKAFQENYGPPEFQNPDEFLCTIKQTGMVTEYRQEYARCVARVRDWPDQCLLGVFLTSLKDELKTEVRIHKPHSVFKAASLALEF